MADGKSRLMSPADVAYFEANPAFEKVWLSWFIDAVKEENIDHVIDDFRASGRDWEFKVSKVRQRFEDLGQLFHNF